MPNTLADEKNDCRRDQSKRSRIIREIIANIFAITCVCLLIFSSCDLGRSPLIGSWTPEKSSTAPWGYPDVFTLNADGTGKCDGFNILRWKTQEKKLIIETDYEYLEYEYKLSFGKLTLDGVPYTKSR